MFSKFCRTLVPFIIITFVTFTLNGLARGEEKYRSPNPYASVTTKAVVAPMVITPTGPIITPLKKDQKAPYDGVLLSPEAVASIVATIQVAPEVIEVEVKKEVAETTARCNLTTDNLRADLKYEKDTAKTRINGLYGQIDILQKQLKKAENDRPNLPMWVGGGAIGGIIVTVLVVFAVNQASK